MFIYVCLLWCLVYTSICLSAFPVYLYVYTYCLFMSFEFCLYFVQFVYLFVCLSVCLIVCLSFFCIPIQSVLVYISMSISVYLICLYLSILHTSVRLLCLHVCLSTNVFYVMCYLNHFSWSQKYCTVKIRSTDQTYMSKTDW